MINPYMNKHPSIPMTSLPATDVAKFMEQNLNVTSPRYGKSLSYKVCTPLALCHVMNVPQKNEA